MLADYFWKVLFAILVGVGCYFWLKSSSAKKTYRIQVAELAEILDMGDDNAPKSDTEAEQRTFKAIAQLRNMELRKGDKFDVTAALEEAAGQGSHSADVADRLAKVFEVNYKQAQQLGLLNDDDAIYYMTDGTPPKITTGTWSGQNAAAGYHIPPSIEPSIANHLCNRTIVPEHVKSALAGGEITKAMLDHARYLKSAKVLDLSAYDRINSEYTALRKRARQ